MPQARPNGSILISATGLFLLVILLLQLGPEPVSGYLRLMGGSDNMCQGDGAYCWSEASCCKGLTCRRTWWQYKRSGSGGVCLSPSTSSTDLPAFMQHSAALWSQCDTDWDCPTGECCHSTVVSGRGIRRRVCSQSACPGGAGDVGDILGNYYGRYYYRRAGRAV